MNGLQTEKETKSARDSFKDVKRPKIPEISNTWSKKLKNFEAGTEDNQEKDPEAQLANLKQDKSLDIEESKGFGTQSQVCLQFRNSVSLDSGQSDSLSHELGETHRQWLIDDVLEHESSS